VGVVYKRENLYVFSLLREQEPKHHPNTANVRHRPVFILPSWIEKAASVNSGERSPSFNAAPDTSDELNFGSSFSTEVGYLQSDVQPLGSHDAVLNPLHHTF